MNKPTPLITDDRLQTQIKMAESENNSELILLLLELKQYRILNQVKIDS